MTFVDIPKGEYGDPGPCWVPRGQFKPAIVCKCGVTCHIGLHRVHADGRVTDSFFHSPATEFTLKGKTYSHQPGCGWHEWLKLMNYNMGEFPPEII